MISLAKIWIIGFIAYQPFLGYSMLISVFFFFQVIVWFQVNNNDKHLLQQF